MTFLQTPFLNEKIGLPRFRLSSFVRVFLTLQLHDSASSNPQAAEKRQDQVGWGDAEPPDDLKGLAKLDPEAITQIHNRYFPDVFRFARYRLGDATRAEDIAGETFARMLEATHRGKGPSKNVRSWLMRTAANLINDHYRNVYNKPADPLNEWLAADAPSPGHHVEMAEEKQALHAALQHLTEEQVNVLALRFGSGLSLAETANILGKKANAIKALQFRAINALRKHLTSGTDAPDRE